MMFALAVLDLPFAAEKHETKFDQAQMTLTPGSPLILFHEEIKQVPAAKEQTPILVSQNFFRHGDRTQQVNNEQVDKFVTEEFLVGVVYGCQVVVTNPTSSKQKLDVLLQIPRGAIPVLKGRETRSVHIDLEPYHTQTLEYHFYFPAPGEFLHYPVQVSKNEQLVAHAAPVTLKAVAKLSRIDKASWEYLSQFGTNEDVLKYLEQANLHRTNLDKIAFRVQDKAFFGTVTGLLAQRHAYSDTLWSYSLKHNAPAAAHEYLQHADGFVGQCGAFIDSPLLTIDPVARRAYQHLDYRPLVNARAHQLGQRRQIVNDRFHAQYHQLLKILSYRPDLDDRGVDGGDLLPAAAGPRRRGPGCIQPGACRTVGHPPAVRLFRGLPGDGPRATAAGPRHRREVRPVSGGSLARLVRRHARPTGRDRRSGRQGRRQGEPRRRSRPSWRPRRQASTSRSRPRRSRSTTRT